MAIDLILSSETHLPLSDAQLDNNFNTIQQAVNTSISNISTLQNRVTTAENRLTSTQSDVDTLSSDLSSLQETVGLITPLIPPSFYTQLVLRSQKGSALTNAEMDRNFVYLDARINTVSISVKSINDTTIPTLSSSLTTLINTKQPSDPKLTTFAEISVPGILSTDGSATFSRTITAGSPFITIANGSGLSGNPVIDISTSVVTVDRAQTLTNKTLDGSHNTITNVSLVDGVTGTLPITHGGTGSTSAAAARLSLGALVIPSGTGFVVQTGNNAAVTRSVSYTHLTLLTILLV